MTMAPIRSRLEFGIIVALFDKALRLLGGFLVTGLIARHLGTAEFGILSSIAATVTLISVVIYLGNEATAVRELAGRPEASPSILAAVLLSRTTCALAITIGIFILIVFGMGQNDRRTELFLIGSLGFTSPILSTFGLWFVGQGKAHVAAIANLIGLIASLSARWLLVQSNAQIEAFIWANLIESSTAGLLLYLLLVRSGGRIELSISKVWAECKTLFDQSWPLLIGGLATAIYTRIDILLITWLKDPAEAGIYAAATRLSETAYTIPAYVGVAIMASLMKEFDGRRMLGEVTNLYFRASAALAYVLTFPALIAMPVLIPLVYGAEYSRATGIAQIHILTVFFLSLGIARGRLLVVHGWTRFAMISAMLGCVFNLALNMLLVPRYGALGAAIAAVCAHGFASFGITCLYSKTRFIAAAQVRALLRPTWRLGGMGA